MRSLKHNGLVYFHDFSPQSNTKNFVHFNYRRYRVFHSTIVPNINVANYANVEANTTPRHMVLAFNRGRQQHSLCTTLS